MLSLKIKKGSAVYLDVPGYPPVVVRLKDCNGGSAQLLVSADENIYIRREELVPPHQRVPSTKSD